MSATPTQQPTANDAESFLFRQYYMPVFLDKVASYAVPGFEASFVPQNEQAVDTLLHMAQRLTQEDDAQRTKQAAAGASLLDYAAAALDQSLGQQAATPAWLKSASAEIGARADVQHAFSILDAAAQAQQQARAA